MLINYTQAPLPGGVNVSSTILNGGKRFTTPAKDIVVGAWILMVKLPMTGNYIQTWDLFEPGTKFESVKYEQTFFADGYTKDTVCYIHNGIKYVPILASPNTMSQYPVWSGTGGYASECKTVFQYDISGLQAWGRYELFACPHDTPVNV